ncbi:hypothetical protein J3D55_004083 [Chryseobacterium ginsenosidimutans]|uniref:hypothetical protein n=1 Tax=Chryseobacterium ginsenosidimutans TaxID=687846 RepID=UPI002169D51F|nr:hypothetical protein [Chryseobacterium ginsenosidimutans]MCS3871167.1 hypothetical protein [Chryseobacterium ginsenosidimutans]
MLDFYTIKKDQPTPNYPEKAKLILIGQLDDETFYNLQKKGIIDKSFDYYSDFRWNKEITDQIKKNISIKSLQFDDDIKKLLQIISIAEKNQQDIIAYGD